MKYTFFCLVSTLATLAAIVSLACAGEVQSSRENITTNITTNVTTNITTNITTNLTTNKSNETGMASGEGKVLRAGGKSASESNALGRNRSQKAGTEIGLEPRAQFNLSQRYGSVSKFKFNSDTYTPLFRQNEYTRTKPAYQAPDNLSSIEVYNLTGYPVIMLPNAMP